MATLVAVPDGLTNDAFEAVRRVQHVDLFTVSPVRAHIQCLAICEPRSMKRPVPISRLSSDSCPNFTRWPHVVRRRSPDFRNLEQNLALESVQLDGPATIQSCFNHRKKKLSVREPGHGSSLCLFELQPWTDARWPARLVQRQNGYRSDAGRYGRGDSPM